MVVLLQEVLVLLLPGGLEAAPLQEAQVAVHLRVQQEVLQEVQKALPEVAQAVAPLPKEVQAEVPLPKEVQAEVLLPKEVQVEVPLPKEAQAVVHPLEVQVVAHQKVQVRKVLAVAQKEVLQVEKVLVGLGVVHLVELL